MTGRARSGPLRAAALLGLLVQLSACSSTGPCQDSVARDALSIYVVQRGWHTGVAVPIDLWPNRDWPLLEEFEGADYLEFGWGDLRFYQAERNTFWLGVRAALWPTDSAIHVIALNEPLAQRAHAEGMVEVRISAQGLKRLTAGIEQEFAGSQPRPTGASTAAAPRPNRFYHGERRFYFPRMCNWWVAARLREAGCPISPWTIITASQLMRASGAFAVDDPRTEPSDLPPRRSR